ncbi:DUF4192 domain-containing protein [Arthrobacter luteolus]|uniref:DUF4192 domain-containing protein n=1 Tax=Arthrobacter luteolus TaxID=98672 RepID=UPI00082F853F|nr:DUF4192 domain-containing protein [Arthrobacter luteolus]
MNEPHSSGKPLADSSAPGYSAADHGASDHVSSDHAGRRVPPGAGSAPLRAGTGSPGGSAAGSVPEKPPGAAAGPEAFGPDPFGSTGNTGLSAGSPEDILAFVPHCLGFAPEESLVLLALRGRRLGATLRLDLPSRNTGPRRGKTGRRTADTGFEAAYCARICSLLSGDEEADGALVIVYTEQPWAAGEPPPYNGLVGRLREGLASRGLELRNGWLSGNGHWRDYFCTSQECCPWPGFPLDQIAGSRLNAELVFRGSAYASSLQADAGLRGINSPGSGPSDPVTARSQAASRRRLAGRWTQPEHFIRTLEAWHECFRGHRTPERDGLLLASLESKPVRDAVLVLAAMGLPAAAAGARYWLGLEGWGAGGEAGGGKGSGLPQAGTLEARSVFRNVLIGRGSLVPDWDSLDRAHGALTSLLGPASGESAAAVLTLLGWLEWARGRSSRADLCLSGALRVQPGYRLAQLLQALVMQGELPEWSQSPQTAWRGGGTG